MIPDDYHMIGALYDDARKALERGGRCIRTWRDDHRMAQRDLAEMVGIDAGTLSRIENGHIAPDDHTYQRLIAVLQHPSRLPKADPAPRHLTIVPDVSDGC